MSAASPYRDPALPVADRVADLLGRMTLEEKAAQLAAPSAPGMDVHNPPPTGWGCVVAALAILEAPPREMAAQINELQRKHVEETRLGIPVLVAEEALLGLKVQGVTTFPDAIAQAATWDPELIERMATTIGLQMARTGARQALSPLADTARDPRWGRVEETYGEEPYLVGSMATAFVRGLQEADPGTPLVATVKHFLGYSASNGGRNTDAASIGPRELREVHSAPFEMVIRNAGARGVMPSYAALDGVPVTGSRAHLTGLLRDELGFDGLVISDLGAVDQLYSKHGVAPSEAAAAAQAIRAGVHLDLDLRDTTSRLTEAVRSGLLTGEDLDRAVATVLRIKFELGLFERPYVDLDTVPETLDSGDTRALARTIAEKSVVLLRNEPVDGVPLLPLDPRTATIAVVGPNADRLMGQLGNYSYQVLDSITKRFTLAADPTARADESDELAGRTGADQARLMVASVPVVTFLDGIRERASGTTVLYEPGCPVQEADRTGIPAAVEAARAADIAVVVVGDQSGVNAFGTVGEGLDSTTCELPGVQRELVEAVLATGTPTVVVLSHGRPYAIKWMADSVPAIVTSWFGGAEAGNALAAVLFGDVNPAGRVPLSFLDDAASAPLPYWRAAQTPTYVEGRAGATFAFGHGLSYTTFEYRDVTVDPDPTTDGEITLSFTVLNTGDRAGDEVVQVYAQDVLARTVRPRRQLIAFQRVPLEAGAAVRVTATVPAGLLALWDPEEGWTVEPGAIKFFVGGSSAATRLRTSVTLTGDVHRTGPGRALISTVSTEPVDPHAAPADTGLTVGIATAPTTALLTGDNTVLEWLEHPVGGDLLRGLLQGADEDVLAPAFGLSLRQMVMYSAGRMPAETVDHLEAQMRRVRSS